MSIDDREHCPTCGQLLPVTHSDTRNREVEYKAARTLGMNRETLRQLSLAVWGRPIFAERERRLAAMHLNGAPEPTIQAQRGHLTRQLIAEARAARLP
jgi:hypothetical protein